MATTTKTVFLTDENGNLLVDGNGRPRALTFSVIDGKSLRLAERETIPTVSYSVLTSYSVGVQTYTGITNAAEFSVEDVAVFQYYVWDRGNTRAYVTAQVLAVNDTSLTANGIGISVAGADGKNGATPEIGENGNWYINGEDTGKSSKGAKGDDGKSVTSATAGTVAEADGYTVTPVTFGLSDGSSLPAVPIKAKNAEVEIIDLGEVTLTEQSLGGIKMSYVDGIQITLEQAILAQADNPPIVKIRFNNDDHEFYRTKISTDASAGYIEFAATEDWGEGTRFYNLRITVSESGGASAMLLVWKYNLMDGILNEFDIGTLTFTEDTATRTVTDDEWTLVQGANVIAFRISATSGTTTTIDERFKMYLTHYHDGESNPDSVDLYNRSYFGVVTTQSGTPYGYSAVYDSENKQIIVTKVSLRSGGGSGLAQNEIINREANIDIANEESPDFVENSTELYAKQTIKSSISILSEELDSGRTNAPAVTANNGKIYIFGGISNSEYSDEIIEYDYNEKTIKTLSTKLPSGRDEVAAAFANNGNIYIFGGYTSGNGTYFSDICRFNIETQELTVVGTFDTGIRNIAAATANNGYIYLFGGRRGTSGIGGSLGYTNRILKFSPETETYITIGATLPFEGYCAAVSSNNGKIYIFRLYENKIYEFDPELEIITKTISTIDAILPTAWDLGLASNGLNEKIYLFANYGGSGQGADRFLEFDPKTEILKTADTILPMVKRGSAIATGLDKIIYIIGGGNSPQILAFNSGKSSYKKYTDGKDGTTPHIGDNKHWYIGEEDTGIVAEGKDGATPEIGENGNWYINGEDTGKSSKGAKGDDGKSVTSATAGTVSEADGYTITPIEFVFSDGSKAESVEVKAKHGANGTDAQVTKQKIAEVLNCTTSDLDTIIELAKIILVNGSDVTLTGNIVATGKITGSDINTTT